MLDDAARRSPNQRINAVVYERPIVGDLLLFRGWLKVVDVQRLPVASGPDRTHIARTQRGNSEGKGRNRQLLADCTAWRKTRLGRRQWVVSRLTTFR
jgi:hypothetical protein